MDFFKYWSNNVKSIKNYLNKTISYQDTEDYINSRPNELRKTLREKYTREEVKYLMIDKIISQKTRRQRELENKNIEVGELIIYRDLDFHEERLMPIDTTTIDIQNKLCKVINIYDNGYVLEVEFLHDPNIKIQVPYVEFQKL